MRKKNNFSVLLYRPYFTITFGTEGKSQRKGIKAQRLNKNMVQRGDKKFSKKGIQIKLGKLNW